MSRKTIILCVTAVCVFSVIVAVALFFLYSGTGDSKRSLSADRDFMLYSAVPSDAVAVLGFSDFGSMAEFAAGESSSAGCFISGRADAGKMSAFFGDVLKSSSLYRGMLSCRAVLSVHNIGELSSLLILDAGRSGSSPSESADSLVSLASESGLSAVYADASDYVPLGSPLRKRSLLIVSPSDILIQSSLRHLKSEVSVLDAAGFPEAVGMFPSDNVIVLPASGIGKALSSVVSGKYGRQSGFLSGFAGCTAFAIRENSADGFCLSGRAFSEGGAGDFMNVFRPVSPSSAKVSGMLPSYTVAAASIPLDDVSSYMEAYKDFAETRSLSKNIDRSFAELKKKAGIGPEEWAEALDLKEVAAAEFAVGGSLESVILARPGNLNPRLLCKVPELEENRIYDFTYGGFLSALFGRLFSLPDEEHFIVRDGWLIIGSPRALSEYAGGRATDYTLSSYLADADVEDRLSGRNSYFVSYLSLTEAPELTGSRFAATFRPALDASSSDISYEPLFFSVTEGKSGLELDFRLFRTVVLKSQAPSYERDTEVEIPKGPFKVKNSGTGRMNLFYQQENLYLCLQEESGKGIWGVPFKEQICGCAQTVDYYANGKLQILFAAGTKLHLLDRLGRFVNPPFPVDLGKPVLLGPDVYDFSGRRKYNVMILHTDNTIEMYNLQGHRPAEWKTITAKETIKSLPERIRVGGKTYWVVRTSIQTLLFGFYGGETLTEFTGDRMIRPDSEVKPSGNDAVEVVCYDGKRHTVKLNR